MTRLSTTTFVATNILVFPSSSARRGGVAPASTAPAALRSLWHVSPVTGRLECRWVGDDDASVPYSLAA